MARWIWDTRKKLQSAQLLYRTMAHPIWSFINCEWSAWPPFASVICLLLCPCTTAVLVSYTVCDLRFPAAAMGKLTLCPITPCGDASNTEDAHNLWWFHFPTSNFTKMLKCIINQNCNTHTYSLPWSFSYHWHGYVITFLFVAVVTQ